MALVHTPWSSREAAGNKTERLTRRVLSDDDFLRIGQLMSFQFAQCTLALSHLRRTLVWLTIFLVSRFPGSSCLSGSSSAPGEGGGFLVFLFQVYTASGFIFARCTSGVTAFQPRRQELRAPEWLQSGTETEHAVFRINKRTQYTNSAPRSQKGWRSVHKDRRQKHRTSAHRTHSETPKRTQRAHEGPRQGYNHSFKLS